MNKLVSNLITAALFGGAFLSAGFSPILIHNSEQVEVQSTDNPDHEENRTEFWRKFRESVTPPKENPPKEVKPREIHPNETKPKEIHP